MSKIPSLYKIGHELQSIHETLLETGGEMTDEMNDHHELVQEMLVHKTDNCVSFIQMIDDEIESASKELERVNAFIKTRVKTKEWMLETIKTVMKDLKKERLVGEFKAIALQKNPPSVVINKNAKIPDLFIKKKTSEAIDKKGLKNFINNGGEIAGVAVISGGESVQMKNKKVGE